jgi:Immunity protein 52
MNKITIGAYWQKRPITLRAFADELKKHILQLTKPPFDFSNISMVGRHPNTDIKLDTNLSNLDDLVYRFAWDKENYYENANPDGTPSWLSSSDLGFMLLFECAAPRSDMRIEFSVSAGIDDPNLSNSAYITIQYPDKNEENPFIHYDYLKKILLKLLLFWQPEFGKIMFMPFEDAFLPDGFTDVGWVTYIKDSNASAMRNNPDLLAAGIEMEPVSIGGSLFTIDREMVSPDNETQVARAKLLRAKLMEYRLIES